MPLDVDALLQPLSQTSDGADPRESDRFAEIEREIDKLSSLSGDAIPNWQRVEQLAAEFLSQQSKDYLVAAWLAQAWTERHAMLGVSSGLALLAGLSERFWDTATPKVTRLRGRRNAILWWIDRASSWLEKQTDVTIGAELADQMSVNAKRLDTLLAEKDPEAPSLAQLLSHIQRIPAEQPAVVPGLDGGQSTSPTTIASVNAADSSATAMPSSASAPKSVATVVTPQAFSTPSKIEINSFDDVVLMLKPAQDYIAQIGPALFAFDHAHPLSIYLSRFAARASIFEIPGATNGQTAIAAPPVAIVDAFEKISGSKNAQGLVEFCESRVRSFPFWLDLDYHAARGFAMMGSAGAKMREAIIDMVLAFVDRLPGIDQFSFSNGMPFASLETMTWIKQCRQERHGSGTQDAFGEVKTLALAQVAEGQLDAAVEILQNHITNNRSGREQFRSRIALVQLVVGQNPQADLLSLVEPLIEDCQRLGLEQWEPELASQAWELKARASRQVVMSTNTEIDTNRRSVAQQEFDSAIKHLSVVDFAAASRLSG
jgi:type VI secretion system protein VasJ